MADLGDVFSDLREEAASLVDQGYFETTDAALSAITNSSLPSSAREESFAIDEDDNHPR